MLSARDSLNLISLETGVITTSQDLILLLNFTVIETIEALRTSMVWITGPRQCLDTLETTTDSVHHLTTTAEVTTTAAATATTTPTPTTATTATAAGRGWSTTAAAAERREECQSAALVMLLPPVRVTRETVVIMVTAMALILEELSHSLLPCQGYLNLSRLV